MTPLAVKTPIEPVIEVYYDPNGIMSGKPGCVRARLRDGHGCHDAGKTAAEAVHALVRTIRSFYDYPG